MIDPGYEMRISVPKSWAFIVSPAYFEKGSSVCPNSSRWSHVSWGSLCPLLTRVYNVRFLLWPLYILSKILWTIKSLMIPEFQILKTIFITPL